MLSSPIRKRRRSSRTRSPRAATTADGVSAEAADTLILDDLSDYTCPICLSVQEEPFELPTCAHAFCRTCLEEHLRGDGMPSARAADERICPVCRLEIEE